MKNKTETISPQQYARDKFASHVQSIAFQLTLSRRMIDCLRVVRDYGFPHNNCVSSDPDTLELERTCRSVVKRHHARGLSTYVTDNFVGFMRSLDNRGLITWNPRPWNERRIGERSLFLSRAGELVCALLVEAGLMPELKRSRKGERHV